MSEDFKNLFLVVIQLGAILAVVTIYWKKIFPFKIETGKIKTDKDIWIMWFKVVVSCLPAAVVGILFDDKIDRLFYNWQTVSAMLIIVGIVFLLVENRGARRFTTNSIDDITLAQAFWIGMFQLVAAIFPGYITQRRNYNRRSFTGCFKNRCGGVHILFGNSGYVRTEFA